VVEHLPSMPEILGSVLSTTNYMWGLHCIPSCRTTVGCSPPEDQAQLGGTQGPYPSSTSVARATLGKEGE
jgi:hypothetical protein